MNLVDPVYDARMCDGGDDEEILCLRAEYGERWYVTRRPMDDGPGYLDAAEEPLRIYHIVAADAGSLARDIAKYERDGYLIR